MSFLPLPLPFLPLLLLALVPPTLSLTPGTSSPNFLLPFPIKVNNITIQSTLTLDAHWRWFHNKNNSSQNCYENGWNPSLCPDPITCSNNCAIQGVTQSQYASNYGIKGNGGFISLQYVTKHQYGTNVGSRLYLANSNGTLYQGFNMLSKEIAFDADMNGADCGLNGAVYFVEMPLDGGKNLASGYSAQYGLGYCDAQCPSTNFINGEAQGIPRFFSKGACCAQFDIWESNSRATSMAGHTCNITGLYPCQNDAQCGRSHTPGVCQGGSTDYNPFNKGMSNLFGRGSEFVIDTTKTFTIKTRFFTDNGREDGNLVSIKRYYVQNGVQHFGGEMPTSNLKKLGEAFKRKMVLVFSIWDDYATRMLWLDGVWPMGSTNPQDKRGPCPPESGNPDQMRAHVPNSNVVYSNVRITNL